MHSLPQRLFQAEKSRDSCTSCASGMYAADLEPDLLQECDAGVERSFKDAQSAPKAFSRLKSLGTTVLHVRQACMQQTWARSPAKSVTRGYLRKSFKDAQSAPIFQAEKSRNYCTSCASGMCAADLGQISCKECDAGLFEEEFQRCTVCPKGYFQGVKAQNMCETCIAGTIAADLGQIKCKDCDADPI